MAAFRFEGLYLSSFGELKREPKYVKTETSYSFFGGKKSSDNKEINTEFKYLLRPKNTQVPEGMEG